MKITKIETFRVCLPTRRVHTWAGNYTPIGKDYVLVKLHVESGVVGVGEAQVLKDWGGEFGTRSGETPDTTLIILKDYLFPLL